MTTAPVAELASDFDIAGSLVVAWPTGFESDCWIVNDLWFVKAWKDPSRVVDLSLLAALASAGLPVPVPLRSDLVYTADGRPYAVFPHVQGRHATPDDHVAVGRLLRQVHDLPADHLPIAPRPLVAGPPSDLRSLLDHPWLVDRADELTGWLERYDHVLEQARAAEVPDVLSHDDLNGTNVLIDDNGEVAAALDWDWARLGPREHDLWMATDHAEPEQFLAAYGIEDLDLDLLHVEFGFLRRALTDLAVRVTGDVDGPGVTTWGFDRLARLDETLSHYS